MLSASLWDQCKRINSLQLNLPGSIRLWQYRSEGIFSRNSVLSRKISTFLVAFITDSFRIALWEDIIWFVRLDHSSCEQIVKAIQIHLHWLQFNTFLIQLLSNSYACFWLWSQVAETRTEKLASLCRLPFYHRFFVLLNLRDKFTFATFSELPCLSKRGSMAFLLRNFT